MEFIGEKMSLSKKELVQFQRNAFEISWISHEEKGKHIEMLEDYAASH
jgi:adenosine deaminase